MDGENSEAYYTSWYCYYVTSFDPRLRPRGNRGVLTTTCYPIFQIVDVLWMEYSGVKMLSNASFESLSLSSLEIGSCIWITSLFILFVLLSTLGGSHISLLNSYRTLLQIYTILRHQYNQASSFSKHVAIVSKRVTTVPYLLSNCYSR